VLHAFRLAEAGRPGPPCARRPARRGGAARRTSARRWIDVGRPHLQRHGRRLRVGQPRPACATWTPGRPRARRGAAHRNHTRRGRCGLAAVLDLLAPSYVPVLVAGAGVAAGIDALLSALARRHSRRSPRRARAAPGAAPPRRPRRRRPVRSLRGDGPPPAAQTCSRRCARSSSCS
jgi:hypothetical protein